MSDMSDTIERLGDWQEYTVTRYQEQGTTDGIADPVVVDSTFPIVASIQPATGKDLQRLPEGLRTSEVLAVWTKTFLRVLGTVQVSGNRQPPDTLVYESETYQIETCDRWVQAGNYFKVLARKV